VIIPHNFNMAPDRMEGYKVSHRHDCVFLQNIGGPLSLAQRGLPNQDTPGSGSPFLNCKDPHTGASATIVEALAVWGEGWEGGGGGTRFPDRLEAPCVGDVAVVDEELVVLSLLSQAERGVEGGTHLGVLQASCSALPRSAIAKNFTDAPGPATGGVTKEASSEKPYSCRHHPGFKCFNSSTDQDIGLPGPT